MSSMSMSMSIDQLRTKVLELGTPAPTLSADDIRAAERQLGVRLPASYVEVITVIGNGPHGLFFELAPDDRGHWGWNSDDGDPRRWLRKFLRKPFRHTVETSTDDHPFFESDDWHQRLEEDSDAAYEWFGENRNDIIDEAWCDQHFQGSVAIKHYGCAIRDRLIISGPEAGNVWHSPEGLDFRLVPGPPFQQWLLEITTRRLAGDPWS
jgi:hypothetical protein